MNLHDVYFSFHVTHNEKNSLVSELFQILIINHKSKLLNNRRFFTLKV